MTTLDAESITAKDTHPYVYARSNGMVPDTGRVLRILWYRKWHIFYCAFFFGLAAFVVTARQPELFSAETRILLDPRKVNVVLTSEPVVSDLDLTNATVESEIARIASFAAVANVVREIGAERLGAFDSGIRQSTGPVRAVDWVKELLSPSIVRNDSLISSDERSLQRVTNALARGTRAYRLGNSFVIGLRVTTSDPVLSRDIVNSLTQLYVAQQLEERRSIARAATQWHENQLVIRRQKMIEAETRVEGLRRQNLSERDMDTEILALQLSEAVRRHGDAQSDLAIARARKAALKKGLADHGHRAFARARAHEPFIELLAEEQALISLEDSLAMEFGFRHPKRVANAQNIKRLDLLIKAAVDQHFQAVESDLSVLATLEGALDEDVQKLQNTIVDAKAATQQLRLSEIEATSTRNGYEELVGRLAELQAQTGIQMPDARILSLAQIPTGPSAPRPKFMGFLGASIGASFGLFAVLMFEVFARGVGSREELQYLTDAEVICVLPQDSFGKAAGILSRLSEHRFVAISERLQQLHLVLDHMSKGEKRIVLVTSALPNEGRSTVAFSLASLNAQLNRRTLLVTSAKKPIFQAHGVWHQDHDFDWAPLSLEGTENTVTSLHAEMTEWRALYDVVIVDGPPLMAHSQGLSLAQEADEIVFVVEHLRTPKRAISNSLALLKNVSVSPSAFVLNKSDKRLDPDMHVDQAK